MRRILLIAAFVLLLLVDVWGVSQLLALIGLALMFSVAHHGGMWAPSIVIAVALNAGLIWLTIIVGRRLRADPAHRSAPTTGSRAS
jgi:hypothetical protein